jgi:hypothetical protein
LAFRDGGIDLAFSNYIVQGRGRIPKLDKGFVDMIGHLILPGAPAPFGAGAPGLRKAGLLGCDRTQLLALTYITRL